MLLMREERERSPSTRQKKKEKNRCKSSRMRRTVSRRCGSFPLFSDNGDKLGGKRRWLEKRKRETKKNAFLSRE